MTNEAGFELLRLEYSRVPKYLRDINTIYLFLHLNKRTLGDNEEVDKIFEILCLYAWNSKLWKDDYCLWETIIRENSYSDYLVLTDQVSEEMMQWLEE